METVQEHSQLTALAIVVVAALACGMTMQRLRQPAVLGYIVAGVILGPSGLGLVENRAFIQVLAELGVLMLLFLIAMEMSLRGIREVWKIAVFTTLTQVLAGLGVMWAIGTVLDWTTPHIVLLGFVVAVSSTAVAIKMLEEIGELRSRVGQITVGVLIAQDLAVVPMMLIVGSFRGGGSLEPIALVKVAGSIVFLAVLIVYLSRRKRIRLPFSRLIGEQPRPHAARRARVLLRNGGDHRPAGPLARLWRLPGRADRRQLDRTAGHDAPHGADPDRAADDLLPLDRAA